MLYSAVVVAVGNTNTSPETVSLISNDLKYDKYDFVNVPFCQQFTSYI